MVNEVKTYKEVPSGFEKSTCKDDFLDAGRRKVGLTYLLWSEIENCWQEYSITVHTKWENLKEFVEAGRCYVISND